MASIVFAHPLPHGRGSVTEPRASASGHGVRRKLYMNPKTIKLALFVWILALGLGVSVPLRAQVAGATLSGTITDPQGGAIPNAKVSAKNMGTGVSTDTITNSAGAYTAPNLIPGDYQVTVSAAGFATALTKVTLTVGAKQELNVPLSVGQAAT